MPWVLLGPRGQRQDREREFGSSHPAVQPGEAGLWWDVPAPALRQWGSVHCFGNHWMNMETGIEVVGGTQLPILEEICCISTFKYSYKKQNIDPTPPLLQSSLGRSTHFSVGL